MTPEEIQLITKYHELSRSFGSNAPMSDDIREKHEILQECVETVFGAYLARELKEDTIRAVIHVMCCRYTGDDPGTADKAIIEDLGHEIIDILMKLESQVLDDIIKLEEAK